MRYITHLRHQSLTIHRCGVPPLRTSIELHFLSACSRKRPHSFGAVGRAEHVSWLRAQGGSWAVGKRQANSPSRDHRRLVGLPIRRVIPTYIYAAGAAVFLSDYQIKSFSDPDHLAIEAREVSGLTSKGDPRRRVHRHELRGHSGCSTCTPGSRFTSVGRGERG